MDTRKLVHFHAPRHATNRIGISGQGPDTAITVKQKGRARHHIQDARGMASELAKRWNAFPELVGFLQMIVNGGLLAEEAGVIEAEANAILIKFKTLDQ